jgi:ketopantoate reductase
MARYQVNDRVKQVCSILNEAGIYAEISSTVQVMVWKKLVVNACYNTLSAVFGLKVGDLIDQPDVHPIFHGIVA